MRSQSEARSAITVLSTTRREIDPDAIRRPNHEARSSTTSEKSWKTRSRSANEMETYESRRSRFGTPEGVDRGTTVSTERDRRETVQPIPTPKNSVYRAELTDPIYATIQPTVDRGITVSTERDSREAAQPDLTADFVGRLEAARVRQCGMAVGLRGSLFRARARARVPEQSGTDLSLRGHDSALRGALLGCERPQLWSSLSEASRSHPRSPRGKTTGSQKCH